MNRSSQVAEHCRQWLAVVLRGEPVSSPETWVRAEDLLAVAREEGVTALVAARLPAIPVRPLFTEASRSLAVASLVRTAECQRVLAQLDQAGMPSLLLKGSALASWLYSEPFLRECGDVDLLLPSREAVVDAAKLFSAAGYEFGYGQGAQAYELAYRRAGSGQMRVDFDVHWALNNAAVFARTFSFEELYAASIPIPAIAANARGLSPVHALLHACMHRAINLYTGIGERLKWLYDIDLLSKRMTSAEWAQVLELCGERRLGSVCLVGLEAAAEWLGGGAPEDVLQALRALPLDGGVDGNRLRDWHYMQRMNLRALPTYRARVAWMLRKVFPTVEHMREMYGVDRGPFGLLLHRVRVLIRKAS